jgi:hypothetical protein
MQHGKRSSFSRKFWVSLENRREKYNPKPVRIEMMAAAAAVFLKYFLKDGIDEKGSCDIYTC